MRAGTGTRRRAACDALIAVAAALTVVVPRWPWFKARLLPLDPNAGGPVMAPQGSATGLYAHPFVRGGGRATRPPAGALQPRLAPAGARRRHPPGGRIRPRLPHRGGGRRLHTGSVGRHPER